MAVAIHLTGSFWIGYLCDDYGLLEHAPSVRIFRPLEGHHFSPIITLLFKAASAGAFPALAWHSLALAIHMTNTLMLFVLARVGLRLDLKPALAATALFSAIPVGYEAVAWACAIGYVMVVFPILIALVAALTVTRRSVRSVSFWLAILQPAALLMWDWGILLFPMVSASMILWVLPRRQISIYQAAKVLLPCAGACCFLFALKSSLGYRPGYHPMSTDVLALGKMLIHCPTVSLLPNIPYGFLDSTPGVLLAMVFWILLLVLSIKFAVIRVAFGLYLVSLMPALLFTGPQSRYFYIGAPFFAVMSVAAIGRIRARRFARLLLVALIASHFFFAIQRSQLWSGAYRSAVIVRDAIMGLEIPEGRELVILNLPAHYGPSHMIWRPYVWQGGTEYLGRPFTRVNTPDCPFVWTGAPVPVMERGHVVRMYPDAAIYEVKYENPGDWHGFGVSPFNLNQAKQTGGRQNSSR